MGAPELGSLPVFLFSHVALSPHSCHLAGPHPSLQPLALLGGPLGPNWKEGWHRGYGAPPGLSDSVRWTEVGLGILGTGIAQTKAQLASDQRGMLPGIPRFIMHLSSSLWQVEA